MEEEQGSRGYKRDAGAISVVIRSDSLSYEKMQGKEMHQRSEKASH